MKKQKYNNNKQKSIRKSNKGKIALATVGLTTVALGATYGVFHKQINAGVSSVFDQLRNPSTKVEQEDKTNNQTILIDDLKNELAVKNAEIQKAVEQIEALTSSKTQLEAELQAKSSELADKETALADLQTEFDETTAEYTTKKAELEAELESLGGQNTQLETQLQSLQAEYDAKTAEFESEKTSLNNEISHYEVKVNDLLQQRTNLEEQLSSEQVRYNRLASEYDELEEKYNNAFDEAITKIINNELESLKIPDGITTLGESCISNKSIKSIDLNQVTTINGDFFSGMEIENLDLKNVTTISADISFYGDLTSTKLTTIAYNLGQLSAPKSIDLSKCENLSVSGSFINSRYVTKLPNVSISATAGGAYNFCGKYVEINDINFFGFGNVEPITLCLGSMEGTQAECIVLKSSSVISGENVSRLRINALSDADDDMYESLITTGNILSKVKIYVPDDLVDSYKTSPLWSKYADIILPISEMPEGVDTVEYWENLEA